MLALLLRWSDQRTHGRRCRWCGAAGVTPIAGIPKSTCSTQCRDQLSAYWDLGN